MIRAKWILLGMIVFMMLALGVGLYKHVTRVKGTTTPLDVLPEGVDVSLREVHFIQANRNQKEWELNAKQVKYLKDQDVAFLSEIRLKFFLKDGGVTRVSAQNGRFYNSTKDFTIWGDVEMENDQGHRLTTTRMEYVEKEKKVFAPQKVIFTAPLIHMVTGDQMIYNINTQTLTINGNVECRLNEWVKE